MKVTCVEGRGTLGGTCLNVGCIPSKVRMASRALSCSSLSLLFTSKTASGFAIIPPILNKRQGNDHSKRKNSKRHPPTLARSLPPPIFLSLSLLFSSKTTTTTITTTTTTTTKKKKALLHSSHIYETATKHAEHHGVLIQGARIDVPRMMAQKDAAVSGLTKGIEGLFKKNKVGYVKGWASFKSPTEVEVSPGDNGGEAQTLRAKNVIIATGSEVTPLPGLEIDEEKIVSSTGALKLKEVPKTLIVIGGGYIGLEMVKKGEREETIEESSETRRERERGEEKQN